MSSEDGPSVYDDDLFRARRLNVAQPLRRIEGQLRVDDLSEEHTDLLPGACAVGVRDSEHLIGNPITIDKRVEAGVEATHNRVVRAELDLASKVAGTCPTSS
jgi:hypothetical protein